MTPEVTSQPKAELPAIEFRGVTVSFDENRALDDVTFQLRRGEMMIVTGAAGSGKSVLLRLAIGLLTPDEGGVLVEGQSLGAINEEQLLALRSRLMGIVFQEDSLFTSLSVYDNTAYRLVEHNWNDEQIDQAVHEILRFVGLEEDIDKLPEELSIGMGRRLEFARALVGWPAIMLFDEATAGLDPINARMMLDLVIRARDLHSMSALYVTKELHEIPYLNSHVLVTDADGSQVREAKPGTTPDTRVMLLDKGRIAFLGTSAEFESSTLPVVTRMTHPESGLRRSTEIVADPWSRSRTR
jgi:phospholipid/cholesterol/gamma-HCH transport system ATP-binding protein